MLEEAKSSLLEPPAAGEGKFTFSGEVRGSPEKDVRPLELFGSGM